MVMPTEKTPHGLSPRALTTTRARMATMITMMSRVAISAAVPPMTTEFLAGHLAQGASAAAHGEEHDEVVLDGAGEDDADDDPDGAGQVAHLGGEDRAHQGAGAGDGGEVVAEEDVAVGADVVLAVRPCTRRGWPGGRWAWVMLRSMTLE